LPFLPFFEIDSEWDSRQRRISSLVSWVGNLTFGVMGGKSGKKRQWYLPFWDIVATRVAMSGMVGMVERPLRWVRMGERMEVACGRMGMTSGWHGSGGVIMEFIFAFVKALDAGGGRGDSACEGNAPPYPRRMMQVVVAWA
jgi:hypothetical protein